MKKIYHIGLEYTLDIISGKWKGYILCHLGNSPMRTNELKRKMNNISQKVLTEQLKDLEKHNIIKKTVYNETPPRVEYSLTDEGRTLRDILISMSIWGEESIKRKQEKGEKIDIINNNHEGFINM